MDVVPADTSGGNDGAPDRELPGASSFWGAVQLSHSWNPELWEQIAAITPDGAPRPVFERRQKHVRLEAASRLALSADYESGATLEQVAKKYGVHVATAARCVTNAGVTVRQQEIKVRPEDLPAIQDLHRGGMSLEAIGRTYNCTGLTIAKHLRRYKASSSAS